MNNHKLMGLLVFLALATFGLSGCGDVNKEGAASVYPHPAGWVVATGGSTHPAAFHKNQDVCVECHGSAQDAELSGGISKVSCFSTERNGITCHPAGPGQNPHTTGWTDSANHGASAKLAPSTTSNVDSFTKCASCHASGTPSNVWSTCGTASCHTSPSNSRPHPADWQGSGTYSHKSTNDANAVVCATCHTAGANSPILAPNPPAPAGTAPGCFNSTLCHGASANPHTTGWTDPTNHGTNAKLAPSTTNNVDSFTKCANCHASGTLSNVWSTCGTTSCHTSPSNSRPHPADWQGSGTYSHKSTNDANAAVCATCHTAGLNSPLPAPNPPATAGTAPGCFNSTLCHGASANPHTTGWTDPTNHGTNAKLAPSTTNNVDSFTKCASCHASGTLSNVWSTCGTALCHTSPSNSRPHPAVWDVTGTFTHQTTDGANAVVCATCHTDGVNSPIPAPNPPATAGTAPGCFNSTLCHAQVGGTEPAHPVHLALPTSDISCTTCHSVALGVLNFNAAYNAKSGAASFNDTANTCANTSCHGGQTTPVWATGVIAVPGNGNSDCKVCHSDSTAQYNSYVSGRHDLHVNGEGYACTLCHDTTQLALTHFTTLNTSELNNPPATIKTTIGYTNGSCATPGCHVSDTW